MKSCLRLTAILLTLMLLLSACKKNESEFVLSEFSGVASFCCEGVEYRGDFVMKNKDEMTFTVSTPEIIKGSEFTCVSGKTSLSFDGITIDVRAASPIKALFEALVLLAETPHSVLPDGSVVLAGNPEKGSFEAKADPDKIKIKEINTGDVVYIFS